MGQAEEAQQHDVREAVEGLALLLQDEHRAQGAGQTAHLQVRRRWGGGGGEGERSWERTIKREGGREGGREGESVFVNIYIIC